ncbi:PREDICTED: uncharacterized protein LOC109228237 isoform X2 [Nicotiana attenuata]|uniref:uncharacterized protein LOC109228237 isoform X2 n=1 Tax=Nicotiana attenuata TaxID=49451 RepID=UPI0009045D67|nr:PREDICTED: uncharacterized protein LOC109228237 isoform X2 [Nicotiana attenuata]
MGVARNFIFLRKNNGVLLRVLFSLWFIFGGFCPVLCLRPLRERYRSWGDEVARIITIACAVVSVIVLKSNKATLDKGAKLEYDYFRSYRLHLAY